MDDREDLFWEALDRFAEDLSRKGIEPDFGVIAFSQQDTHFGTVIATSGGVVPPKDQMARLILRTITTFYSEREGAEIGNVIFAGLTGGPVPTHGFLH